jgi:Cdc6-like AAA superfamily ATPase
MSLAYAAERIPAPLVTNQQLERELSFIKEYDLARVDRWIASLATTIDPAPTTTLQQKLCAALVARLAPYHAWHDAVPFPTLDGLNRGGIPVGVQFANQAPVTLGPELEHILVYGPTGSGKSHLLAHLLRAVLDTEVVP